MRTDELDFDLPEGLIATRPADPRDSARLMVLSRSDPARLEHRRVSDLPELLRTGDLMVFNATRVLPARFTGFTEETKGKAQGLWLGERGGHADGRPVWRVMIKARRHRPGRHIRLLGPDDRPSDVVLELLEPAEGEEAGAWWAGVSPGGSTPGLLARVGLTPLPPYILQARKHAGESVADAEDRTAYQTVYAHGEEGASSPTPGSVAAPTAGLHFTPALLEAIARRGVSRAEVTLHVGAGTFKPVETDTVEDHPMHAEWCSIDAPARAAVADASADPGRRVIAVGTTSARTLESHAVQAEAAAWLETRLLITPGYRWRVLDGLMTNFHLPRSTLLAMVAALLEGDEPGSGIERLMMAYREAISNGYRFFSYGDAMLILP